MQRMKFNRKIVIQCVMKASRYILHKIESLSLVRQIDFFFFAHYHHVMIAFTRIVFSVRHNYLKNNELNNK